MINAEDKKNEIVDVPAFLNDPRPSERLKCPTLLVAWLRTTGESTEPEPARHRGDADEDRP